MRRQLRMRRKFNDHRLLVHGLTTRELQLQPPDQDCLCRACLTEAISQLSSDVNETTDPSGSQTYRGSLVEGEDYYLEGAAMVFTASFLLRQRLLLRKRLPTLSIRRDMMACMHSSSGFFFCTL